MSRTGQVPSSPSVTAGQLHPPNCLVNATREDGLDKTCPEPARRQLSEAETQAARALTLNATALSGTACLLDGILLHDLAIWILAIATGVLAIEGGAASRMPVPYLAAVGGEGGRCACESDQQLTKKSLTPHCVPPLPTARPTAQVVRRARHCNQHNRSVRIGYPARGLPEPMPRLS